MKGTKRLGGPALAVVLFATACSTGVAATVDAEPTATTTDAVVTDSSASDATATAGESSAPAAPDADCPAPSSDAVPWGDGPTAEAVTLLEGDVRVDAVVYPRPDYDGRPWSQWGQGIVTADGRFLSAIGDHQGADGNSFIYEYDPATGTLTQIADALSLVDHVPGDWGFGKIHAPMVPGPCGEVYTATYWGSRRNLAFTEGYQGDVLLRIDPVSRTIENRGVILPEHGVASMASWPEGGLLYSEAADPFGQKTGSFLVQDMATGEVVFEDTDDEHNGYRSIAVDEDGRAYITWGTGGMARYDPATNDLEILDVTIPGSMLRWADSSGREDIYAVSRSPETFFTIAGDGSVAEQGPALGYVASFALSPDGSTAYYIPHAHGGAWQVGTPVIARDTATGEETTLVELNPLLESEFGLKGGGTYNVVMDPSGDRLFIGINAGDIGARDAFGEIVLVVVTLS